MDALFDVPNASSVMNALKDDFENTLIVSAGDNYITGPFFKASSDKAMQALLGKDTTAGRADILINNLLGIQASVVGNHEFDAGPSLFHSLLLPEADYAGAAFPYLSANLDFSESVLADRIVADNQLASEIASSIARTCIVDVNGRRIGIVGATTPTLPEISAIGAIEVSPGNSADYRALAEVIQKSVDGLTELGIDIVILLAHMQDLAIEEELAAYLDDVDIIVGGGSDSILLDENDRPRDGDADLVYGTYPLWKTSKSGQRIAVLNTDGQYRYVGRFVARFDADGVLTDAYDADESGAFATDAEGVASLGNEAADPKIVEIIEALKSLILSKDQNILGNFPEYLEARKSVIRTKPTNLGKLIAQANLWYAQKYSGEGIHVAIANAGGIRASIGVETVLPGRTEVQLLATQATTYKVEGDISQLDIEAAQAFNNELVLVSLTAAQLKVTLEDACRLLPRAHGGYPQTAGMQLEIDANKRPRIVNTETGKLVQSGERVRELKIGNKVLVTDGEIVAEADTYFRIVTLKYLANGGNGYPIKEYIQENLEKAAYVLLSESIEKEGTSIFAPAGTEQDALAEYLMEFHGKK